MGAWHGQRHTCRQLGRAARSARRRCKRQRCVCVAGCAGRTTRRFQKSPPTSPPVRSPLSKGNRVRHERRSNVPLFFRVALPGAPRRSSGARPPRVPPCVVWFSSSPQPGPPLQRAPPSPCPATISDDVSHVICLPSGARAVTVGCMAVAVRPPPGARMSSPNSRGLFLTSHTPLPSHWQKWRCASVPPPPDCEPFDYYPGARRWQRRETPDSPPPARESGGGSERTRPRPVGLPHARGAAAPRASTGGKAVGGAPDGSGLGVVRPTSSAHRLAPVS